VSVQFDLRCLAAFDGEQHLQHRSLVVLVGLACKNAILIVEFAKQIQDRDQKDRFTAAVEACRLRLRPILMTSFAFIFGVVSAGQLVRVPARKCGKLSAPRSFSECSELPLWPFSHARVLRRNHVVQRTPR